MINNKQTHHSFSFSHYNAPFSFFLFSFVYYYFEFFLVKFLKLNFGFNQKKKEKKLLFEKKFDFVCVWVMWCVGVLFWCTIVELIWTTYTRKKNNIEILWNSCLFGLVCFDMDTRYVCCFFFVYLFDYHPYFFHLLRYY